MGLARGRSTVARDAERAVRLVDELPAILAAYRHRWGLSHQAMGVELGLPTATTYALVTGKPSSLETVTAALRWLAGKKGWEVE